MAESAYRLLLKVAEACTRNKFAIPGTFLKQENTFFWFQEDASAKAGVTFSFEDNSLFTYFSLEKYQNNRSFAD